MGEWGVGGDMDCLALFGAFVGVNVIAFKNNCTVVPVVRSRIISGRR